MYVDLRGFHDTYFGSVPNLETVSKKFFEDCLEGNDPLFDNGWTGWPQGAKQDDVLSWLALFTEKLTAAAKSYAFAPVYTRRLLRSLTRLLLVPLRNERWILALWAIRASGKTRSITGPKFLCLAS